MTPGHEYLGIADEIIKIILDKGDQKVLESNCRDVACASTPRLDSKALAAEIRSFLNSSAGTERLDYAETGRNIIDKCKLPDCDKARLMAELEQSSALKIFRSSISLLCDTLLEFGLTETLYRYGQFLGREGREAVVAAMRESLASPI